MPFDFSFLYIYLTTANCQWTCLRTTDVKFKGILKSPWAHARPGTASHGPSLWHGTTCRQRGFQRSMNLTVPKCLADLVAVLRHLVPRSMQSPEFYAVMNPWLDSQGRYNKLHKVERYHLLYHTRRDLSGFGDVPRLSRILSFAQLSMQRCPRQRRRKHVW